MPEISEKSPFSLCCLQNRDEGICITRWITKALLFILPLQDISATIETLCGIQNQFLEEIMELSANGCRALLLIKTDDDTASLSSRSIHNIKESGMQFYLFGVLYTFTVSYTEILTYKWKDSLLHYSFPQFENRTGSPDYDFEKIELELARLHASGKVIIDILVPNNSTSIIALNDDQIPKRHNNFNLT